MFHVTIVIITEIYIGNENINVNLPCKFQRNIQLSLVMIPEIH